MECFVPDLLAGRNAFVAGGSSGINLAIARTLAAKGATVAVASRSAERTEAARSELQGLGGKAYGYVADVRDFAAVDAAIAAFHAAAGPIDIVVSGAAGNFIAAAHTMSANAFRTVIEIDLLGTFHVYRAAFERLRRPGASLIAISAPQATAPTPGQAHVGAAKAGVDMLTRCLAIEWGAAGVRVNAIVPGPIEGTEGMARLAPHEAARRAIARTVPLGRFGRTDEVAQMALFLASPAAGYVTGAVLHCDGGQAHTMAGAMLDPAIAGVFNRGAPA